MRFETLFTSTGSAFVFSQLSSWWRAPLSTVTQNGKWRFLYSFLSWSSWSLVKNRLGAMFAIEVFWFFEIKMICFYETFVLLCDFTDVPSCPRGHSFYLLKLYYFEDELMSWVSNYTTTSRSNCDCSSIKVCVTVNYSSPILGCTFNWANREEMSYNKIRRRMSRLTWNDWHRTSYRWNWWIF